MTTIGFIILLSVLAIIAIITIIKLRFERSRTYPEYYKDVEITFRFPGSRNKFTKKAWLSVNDNLEYIWTLSNSNLIIDDDWVIKWKYLDK